MVAQTSDGIENLKSIQQRFESGEKFQDIIGLDVAIYSDAKDATDDLFQIEFGDGWVSINLQSGFDCELDDGEEAFNNFLNVFVNLECDIEYAEFVNEHTELGQEGRRWETNSNGEIEQLYFTVEPEFFHCWKQFKDLDWPEDH